MDTETKDEKTRYKIDGVDFSKIKILVDNFNQVRKENAKREKNAQDELFNTVADTVGVKREEIQGWHLNAEYEDLGHYIVEKGCNHPLHRLLDVLASGKKPDEKEAAKAA